MSTIRPDVVIYTTGHSNSRPEEIIRLLEKHQIRILADVRSVPYSQYAPLFNRETFEAALGKRGIKYRFFGDNLGGRPQDPSCYKSGQLPTGKADYLHLVDYEEVARRPKFRNGIERLLQLAAERRTAIMCTEEDPRHCHRHHLIAVNLLAMDARVRHIRHTKQGDFTEDAALVIEKEKSKADKVEQLDLLGLG